MLYTDVNTSRSICSHRRFVSACVPMLLAATFVLTSLALVSQATAAAPAVPSAQMQGDAIFAASSDPACVPCDRTITDAAGLLPPREALIPVSALGRADAERALDILSQSPSATDVAPTPGNSSTSTSWQKIPAGGPRSVLTPPTRDGAGATYDAARGVVVVFGGRHVNDDGSSYYLDDTWTWDGKVWAEQHPTTKPSARAFTVMAYDAALRKGVLFGGRSPAGASLNDTWTWDGTNWVQVTTATSPPGRTAASLAYDEPRQKLVLFGGFSFPSYLGDTWLFDGTDWVQALSPVSPTARYGNSSLMTYVPANGGLVLFGGTDSLGQKNDTWLWNGSTWAPLVLTSSPPARFDRAITYDSANQRAVLYTFGGATQGHGETWTWDGQNWQRIDATSPVARYGEVFVYHPGVEQVLMYSGALCFGLGVTPSDEWLWDGAQWKRVDLGEKSPSTRHYIQGQMAFDSERGQAVLFGGENGCQYLNDTWSWDGVAWAQIFPAISPSCGSTRVWLTTPCANRWCSSAAAPPRAT
jgi:hypothetical protein